jgi:hypothetical protein
VRICCCCCCCCYCIGGYDKWLTHGPQAQALRAAAVPGTWCQAQGWQQEKGGGCDACSYAAPAARDALLITHVEEGLPLIGAHAAVGIVEHKQDRCGGKQTGCWSAGAVVGSNRDADTSPSKKLDLPEPLAPTASNAPAGKPPCCWHL